MEPRRRFTYHYDLASGGWQVYDALAGREIESPLARRADARAWADQLEASWRRRCDEWRLREHRV